MRRATSQVHGLVAEGREHFSKERRHDGRRQPKDHAHRAGHQPPLLRVAPLHQGQGRNVDEAGGDAVEEGPDVDGVDRGGLGDDEGGEGGEDDAQSDHAPQAPALLPAAHQEHESAHGGEHEEDGQARGSAPDVKHLLPDGSHDPRKAEGESAWPEDGDAGAEDG